MSQNNLYQEWENIHQPWELKYHQGPNFRWPSFETKWQFQWDTIFHEFAGFEKNSFSQEDILVDVGCGSRPALNWFDNGKKYNIDPLLKEYLKIEKINHFWNNFNEDQLISKQAETLQESLIGKASFVLCWNVLDHCFDWEMVLKNCLAYMKNKSFFLLGTDHSSVSHIGHPGIKDQSKFFKFFEENFITHKKIKLGEKNQFKNCRQINLLLCKK